MENNIFKVFLNKGEEKRLLEGHPWVFNNEVKSLNYDVNNIELIDFI